MPFGFGKPKGGNGEVHVDMSAGRNPPQVPPGAKVVGPDWLAWGALCIHLKGEGINPGNQDNVAQLGVPGVACTTRVDESYSGTGSTIPLWFDITLPGVDLTIRESFVAPGQGEGPDAAFQSIQDSVHFFTMGTLPAIRSMYRLGKRGDGVSRGKIMSVSGDTATTWETVIGPALPMLTSEGRTEEVRRAIAGNSLFAGGFAAALVGALRDVSRAHWIKVLLTQRPDGERQAIIALDNVTAPVDPQWFNGVALPSGVFAMCRQFALIYPTGTKKQAPTGDPRTTATLKLEGSPIEISAMSAS